METRQNGGFGHSGIILTQTKTEFALFPMSYEPSNTFNQNRINNIITITTDNIVLNENRNKNKEYT